MGHKKNEMGILLTILLITFGLAQYYPQFAFPNNTLGALTNYKMSMVSGNNLTNSTTFIVNFTQSYLNVSNVTTCSIKVGNNIVQKPTCNCSSLVCTFKPNYEAPASVVVEIDIQNVTNPYFLSNQNLNVTINFNSTTSSSYPVVIPA
jgi:hypothetical protein